MPTISTLPAAVTGSVPVATIPFTLREGHILLHATVNGTPATLILDTGSSVSTLSGGWVAAHPVRLLPSTAPVKGTDDLTVSLGTVDVMQIGGIALRDETVAILPLEAVSAAHGLTIDGTIGFGFFARYVVEIDYAVRVLRVYEPDGYAVPNVGVALPIDVSMRVPMVSAQITARGRSPIAARLVLDLGTAGHGVILTSPFRSAHADDFPLDAGIERPLGTGVGGVRRGRVLRLESVRLGGAEFVAPTAAYADAAGGFLGVTWADGTVGAPILSRGSLVVDYPHGRVLLLPAAEPNALFPVDGSGLTIEAVGPSYDRVVVADVVAGSPAGEAGVLAGDILAAVDGKPITGATLDAAHAALQRVGAECVLDLTRNGERRSVRLRLRDLLS